VCGCVSGCESVSVGRWVGVERVRECACECVIGRGGKRLHGFFYESEVT
jgi:hypothetical protein